MKTFVASVSFVAVVVLGTGCTTPSPTTVAPADPHGGVQVNFDHPERFTDAKTSATQEFDPGVLEQLRESLVKSATPRLPAGTTLAITFTNIDLAGDLEPWRIRTGNVRILKELYPPRAAFTWMLQDAKGATLRQGTEQLTDLNFMQRPAMGRGALFADEEMLKDWVRKTLPNR